jgi:hypothetical protein
LKELNCYTLENQEAVREAVAMHLPKLASWTFDATERIRFMWTTKRPALGIQGNAGEGISHGGGKLPYLNFRLALGYRLPFKTEAGYRCSLGWNQGRYSNWLIIVALYFTDNPRQRAGVDGWSC